MIEKRFVCYFDDILKKWCVQDTDSLDMHYVADEPMGEEFAHLLNLYQQTLDKVEKENWQLKQSYAQLKHRHSLLHDECLDVECDRDSYHKDVLSLEKENEKLKRLLLQFYTEDEINAEMI